MEGNGNPFAVDPNLGLLIRGAIKAFGKGSVHVGIDEPAILFCCGDRTMVGDLSEDFLHKLGRGGPNLDDGGTGIVAGLADHDFGDAELAAVCRDRVEDLGQNEAIDDMAGDFHLFDAGVVLGHGIHKWLGPEQPAIRKVLEVLYFGRFSRINKVRPEKAAGFGAALQDGRSE